MVETDNGILIGIVKDLKDPELLGRVRVEYPYRQDQLSDWARLVTPMAGKGRGLRFCPEAGSAGAGSGRNAQSRPNWRLSSNVRFGLSRNVPHAARHCARSRACWPRSW